MLQTLLIKNLALVSELEIEFSSGLNVVTGETGAGKSLIIGAVQLLLGGRGSKSIIRKGAKRAEISGAFLFTREYLGLERVINSMLDGVGVDLCEDGVLLLRRVVTPSGSRCYVNGGQVTMAFLRELGDLLIDLHGPHEHQSLLLAKNQLKLLDTFAGLNEEVGVCGKLYGQMRDNESRLLELKSENISPEEQEFLVFQLAEIDDAELVDGEEEELSLRYKVAADAQHILAVCSQCRQGLVEDDGSVVGQLGKFVQLIDEVVGVDEEHGKGFMRCLEGVVESLNELSIDMMDYAEGIEVDGEELQRMEERLNLIQNLKRKYGNSLGDVLNAAERIRKRLDSCKNRNENLLELQKQNEQLQKKYAKQCAKLTKLRKANCKKLAEKITEKLQYLGFSQAILQIELKEHTASATGTDSVEFCFAPNVGEGVNPLRQIASSGEIARVMLAVKTVLTEADRVPVLIFDEVDANVGGLTAVAVAEELLAIAGHHQVMSITHLPQIAAAGNCHFRVSKRLHEQRTITEICELNTVEREKELARMLGADKDSKTARNHVREMLKHFCDLKNK